MSVIATVVSARMASSRLPGKALLPLGGIPMIDFLFERLSGSQFGGPIIFATTTRDDDDQLSSHVADQGFQVFRGSSEDVAGRYLAVANKFGLDWIVRITADCPFVDAETLDFCLSQIDLSEHADLISTKGMFPIGIDYEVISVATLRSEWPKMSEAEREHLTLRFYKPEHDFCLKYFSPPLGWASLKETFTVDTKDDYDKAKCIVQTMGRRKFPIQDLLKTLKS